MPRYKDEPPAVRVYTVCDESRSLHGAYVCFQKVETCFQCFVYAYILWQVFDCEERSIFGLRR